MEKFNFNQSDIGGDIFKTEDSSLEASQERNSLHDLLWKTIINQDINNIEDISPEDLPRLYLAAEIFSQPASLKELVGGAEDWQVAKAEKLINQLLGDTGADNRTSAV